MPIVFRALLVIISVIFLLLAVGWLGFQVDAASFPTIPGGAVSETLPPPAGLPEPVQRFAETLFQNGIPAIRSAVIVGRARLAPVGFAMPSRFRFYYDAQRSSHYHAIDVTWFNLAFMHIHERNLEGHVMLDLSLLGRVEDAPHTNRAGIQGYWAEVLAWIPSIALSDPRVRWEAVDSTTARLHLPGLDDVEAFTVRFDAVSGLMTEVETMRYQDESRPERWRWFNRILEWRTINGLRVAARAETQWNDDSPWATWELEQVIPNADVSERLAQFGGEAS